MNMNMNIISKLKVFIRHNIVDVHAVIVNSYQLATTATLRIMFILYRFQYPYSVHP